MHRGWCKCSSPLGGGGWDRGEARRGAVLCWLVLAILAVAAAGCGRSQQEAAADAPPPAVLLGPADTAVVETGSVQAGPEITGTLVARRQATVRAQVSGEVLATGAEPGEAVRRGERLARLDVSSLGEVRRSAQAAVTTARSSLALAEREAERQRILADAGAVAERAVETARQQVAAARAQVALAEAQLADARERLADTSVDAPFSGVVSERLVAIGDVVQPGTALYTVVDPSSLELEATVPAEQLGGLAIGAPIELTVSGYPDRRFQGRITRINPSADPATRQVQVYAEIANPGADLVAGLFAEGRVASESRTGLTVPMAAIDRRLQTPAVLKVENGTIERVEVELGLADEAAQRVEVRRGVAAGDVLLVGAAQEITPGTPVRLAPAVEQEAGRLAQAL